MGEGNIALWMKKLLKHLLQVRQATGSAFAIRESSHTLRTLRILILVVKKIGGGVINFDSF